MERAYLTKKELAHYLGVTERYITSLTCTHQIPCYKAFGKNLYKIEEIDRIIQQGRI